MTDPQHVTPAQAADPSIPLQLLADVAARRPDLRAVVAANPATYPALLDWLASLHDADVDAALRTRGVRGTGQPGAGGTTGGFAPLGSAGAPGGPGPAGPAEPYLPVARPAPYTQPDGTYRVPGYGAQPYPDLQPWAPPARKSSNKALWIALAVIGVLIVAVVAVLIALGLRSVQELGVPGGDARLDALYGACAQGDMHSCDDLYMESPLGSDHEAFGDTCGRRTDGGTWCTEEELG